MRLPAPDVTVSHDLDVQNMRIDLVTNLFQGGDFGGGGIWYLWSCRR